MAAADARSSDIERTQLVLLLETFTRRVRLALGEHVDDGDAATAAAANAAADDDGCGSNTSLPSALDTPAVRALLAAAPPPGADHQTSASAAEAYFDGLRARVAATLQQAAVAEATDDDDDGAAAAAAAGLLPVLCAGVRCLRAFVALAVTGPARAGVPSAWVDAVAATDPAAGTPSGSARGGGLNPAPAPAPAPAAAELGRDSATPAERWVAERLREDGEDLETRVPHLDLLLAARACLLAPWERGDDGAGAHAAATSAAAAVIDARLPTWHWWVLRAAALHQQVLSGRAASLHALAARSGAAAVAWARALQQQQQQQQQQPSSEQPAAAAASRSCLPASTAALLCAGAHLELAAGAHLEYGYADLAAAALTAAGGALGVEVAVLGALGRRTAHQRDAKAQLVARVRAATGGGAGAQGGGGAPPLLDEDMAALGLASLVGSARETEGVREDGAVYLAPRLEEEGASGAAEGPHAPTPAIEQALLLAWAALVERRGRSEDELSRWEAAPYVEAVLREPRSQLAVQLAARLMKARHEAGRGRTRERALITLEALADYAVGAGPAAAGGAAASASALAADTDAAVAAADAAAAAAKATDTASAAAAAALAAAQRLPYSFTARQPLLPTLQKELAAAYVALGLPGPALELYARLEAWDALIVCYRLLGKTAAARELISARLDATPDDPSLWCALGDLAEEGGGPGGDRHYEEAWRRSRGRSARAKRSLARSALRRRDYAVAAAHYEDALALSPMHAQAWFSLGYCRLREAGEEAQDGGGAGAGGGGGESAAAASARLAPALRAFSRVTLLEPQHGEAWANLAALWLRAGRPREALSAARQAVRHKRDAWQAWENYAAAALGAGEPLAAARGLREVLSLTRGERLPGSLAEGLVRAVEEGAGAARLGGGEGAEEGRSPQQPEEQGGGAEAAGADDADVEHDDDDDQGAAAAGQDPVQATEALLSLLRLTQHGGDDDADAAAAAAAAATAANGGGRYDGTEASAAVRRRQHAQLLDAASAFLRDAALAPACTAATWALVARVKALRGEQGAAREAWVKACRGLAGDGRYRADAGAFAALAEASTRYGRSCARAYRDARDLAAAAAAAADGGQAGDAAPPLPPALAAAARDLAACRMHLRSVTKQCEERFGGEKGHADMVAALDEVMELEEDAKARRARKAGEE
jgi:hypothetical protein